MRLGEVRRCQAPECGAALGEGIDDGEPFCDRCSELVPAFWLRGDYHNVPECVEGVAVSASEQCDGCGGPVNEAGEPCGFEVRTYVDTGRVYVWCRSCDAEYDVREMPARLVVF